MTTVLVRPEAAAPVITPVLQQYLDIGAAHPGCVVLFRMGDFYEVFFDDAEPVSKVLGIQLTARGGVAMCGIPWHQLEGYLPALINAGYKVALCEQLETPEEARKERGYKALVRREVTRVVTAGTLFEDTLLPPTQPNYLAAVASHKQAMAMAFIEVSTGDVRLEDVTAATLATVLAQYQPSEILLTEALCQNPDLFDIWAPFKTRLSVQPESLFHLGNATQRLCQLYGVQSLDAFGSLPPAAIIAAGSAVAYATLTQKGQLPALKPPRCVAASDVMKLDANARRHLELTTGASGKRQGSLLDIIDATLTPMGGRLLRQHLAAPSCQRAVIEARLDALQGWLEQDALLAEARTLLKTTPDIERSLARLSLNRGGPRDLLTLKQGLEQAERLHVLLKTLPLPAVLTEARDALPSFLGLTATLARALAPDVPFLLRDGGFIAPRYHPRLDELRLLAKDGARLIRDLEQQYQQTAGISSLRIKHNAIIGYFIEVNPKHADALREPFIHRQTLANAARFTTTELAALQTRLLEADSQALALEKEIFQQLVQECLAQTDTIRRAAEALAVLDVSAGLATVAQRYNYCRPQLSDTPVLRIHQGRHPMVEAALPVGQSFTANDSHLHAGQQQWLITGPNMAGKSTFLRQNALIVIMAQLGSYVPAAQAEIGIVDALFTRIGAGDDVAQGRSTFMVEMLETAAIVHQATARSLVILDEIGRGTATYDGLAIAWAVFEHLHDKARCRTLFATHYHELTTLAEQLPNAANFTVAIKEWEKSIVFLHQVVAGKANRSYGVHVARMAGMPATLVRRAETLLHGFENTAVTKRTQDLPLFTETAPPPTSPAVERLRALDVDALTPRDALAALYDLKALL